MTNSKQSTDLHSPVSNVYWAKRWCNTKWTVELTHPNKMVGKGEKPASENQAQCAYIGSWIKTLVVGSNLNGGFNQFAISDDCGKGRRKNICWKRYCLFMNWVVQTMRWINWIRVLPNLSLILNGQFDRFLAQIHCLLMLVLKLDWAIHIFFGMFWNNAQFMNHCSCFDRSVFSDGD